MNCKSPSAVPHVLAISFVLFASIAGLPRHAIPQDQPTTQGSTSQSPCKCWIDVKTGKRVGSVPIVPTGGKGSTVAELSADGKTAFNTTTKQNFALEPCPQTGRAQPPTTPSETTGPVDPCAGKDARQRVTVAQARERINRHIAHIEERKQLMTDTYYYTGAAKTLQNAFKEHGITASMRYAESWGEMGIGLTWSESAKQLYEYHLDTLKESLKVIEQRGYAQRGELAYLESGVQRWDEYDRNLDKQFQALVKVFTAEAKVYDEKEDYLKKYGVTLGQLNLRKPYPSGEINALSNKMYADTKAFDERIKQIDSRDIQKAKDTIADAASKHLFSVLEKVPRC